MGAYLLLNTVHSYGTVVIKFAESWQETKIPLKFSVNRFQQAAGCKKSDLDWFAKPIFGNYTIPLHVLIWLVQAKIFAIRKKNIRINFILL